MQICQNVSIELFLASIPKIYARRFCSYTVKKDSDFPIPSQDVTNQTLPGRESLNYSRPGTRVWYPAWALEIGNLFYSVPYGRRSILEKFSEAKIQKGFFVCKNCNYDKRKTFVRTLDDWDKKILIEQRDKKWRQCISCRFSILESCKKFSAIYYDQITTNAALQQIAELKKDDKKDEISKDVDEAP